MYKWIECKVSGLKAISISGELTYDMVLDLLTKLEELERQSPAGFNRFTDLRKVEMISLDSEKIMEITDRRYASYRGPVVRSAVLASDPSVYGMIRIYTSMMETSPIDVSVFFTLEECAEWLGVNPEDIGLEE